jgi:hypothetical protein
LHTDQHGVGHRHCVVGVLENGLRQIGGGRGDVREFAAMSAIVLPCFEGRDGNADADYENAKPRR